MVLIDSQIHTSMYLVLFDILFCVPLRVVLGVGLARTWSSGAVQGREFYPMTIGIRTWLRNQAYLADESSNIVGQSGMRISNNRITLNREAMVDGTHYNFVREQKSITWVKKVTCASGVYSGDASIG